MAPPVRCDMTVMMALAAESANSGSFSSTSQEKLLAGIAPTVAAPEDGPLPANIRRNGQ